MWNVVTGMSDVTCYWLEPTDKIRRDLRRYRNDLVSCPSPRPDRTAACDCSAYLDTIPYPPKETIESYTWPRTDERWPKKCDRCGYVFQEHDAWQVFVDRIYKRSDTGAEIVLREAGPGAMWDAFWMPDQWKGPDGMCVAVKLPGGHVWMIDGPSQQNKNPGAWTRSGTVPKLTASPSILVPDLYHGWLKEGVLVPC